MKKAIPTVMAALALAALTVPTVLAGPPLVCHPYEIGERPDLMARPEGAGDTIEIEWLVRTLTAALDTESETLVRFEAIRRAAFLASDVAGATTDDTLASLDRVLAARAERARDAAAAAAALAGEGHDPARADQLARVAAMRRFEAVLGHETFQQLASGRDGDEEASLETLQECAELIGDDAALWLGIARMGTPLMRTSTLSDHARAFVQAYDLTQLLPESVARDHLQGTLDHDLDTMEAYLLDPDLRKAGIQPDAGARLAALRRAAGLVEREPSAAEPGETSTRKR